jgi:hypothetical protein
MSRIKTVLFAILALVLVAGFVSTADAGQTTLSATVSSHNGVQVTQYSHTWAAKTDTCTINLVAGMQSRRVGNPFVLYIYTARGATDSVNAFSVKYLWSSDGSNWQSQTLGTDSTTWATTTVYTTGYALNTIAMVTGVNANGGITVHPYMKLVITQASTANLGGRMKVHVNYTQP